jgi:hypothetical protein
MWMPDAPDESAALRQGDLLLGLALPKLTWPLSYARPPETTVAENQMVVLPSGRIQAYLVVSQCCTIENLTVAALAVVRSTQSLTPEQLSEYEREEPSSDPESRYAYNAHALSPFKEHLLREKRRIFIADLTSIQSYSGAISDFQKSRVAAMTPAGRRLLRIRLSYFWGRPEGEDELWFEEHGLPAGESTAEPTSSAVGIGLGWPDVANINAEASAAAEPSADPVLPTAQGQPS